MTYNVPGKPPPRVRIFVADRLNVPGHTGAMTFSWTEINFFFANRLNVRK